MIVAVQMIFLRPVQILQWVWSTRNSRESFCECFVFRVICNEPLIDVDLFFLLILLELSHCVITMPLVHGVVYAFFGNSSVCASALLLRQTCKVVRHNFKCHMCHAVDVFCISLRLCFLTSFLLRAWRMLLRHQLQQWRRTVVVRSQVLHCTYQRWWLVDRTGRIHAQADVGFGDVGRLSYMA